MQSSQPEGSVSSPKRRGSAGLDRRLLRAPRQWAYVWRGAPRCQRERVALLLWAIGDSPEPRWRTGLSPSALPPSARGPRIVHPRFSVDDLVRRVVAAPAGRSPTCVRTFGSHHDRPTPLDPPEARGRRRHSSRAGKPCAASIHPPPRCVNPSVESSLNWFAGRGSRRVLDAARRRVVVNRPRPAPCSGPVGAVEGERLRPGSCGQPALAAETPGTNVPIGTTSGRAPWDGASPPSIVPSPACANNGDGRDVLPSRVVGRRVPTDRRETGDLLDCGRVGGFRPLWPLTREA